MVSGLPPLLLTRTTCEACVLGKHHRQSISKVIQTITTCPLELVHSDLCGPFPQKSLTGSRYMLTFIDNFSRRSWVYFLTTKDETLESFKHWRKTVEIESNLKVSYLRTNKGGDYLSTAFTSYCKSTGVCKQLTAVETPQQNGIIDHKNQHLYETTCTLLFGANLPPYLWEEAARAANFITNRMPHHALHRTTPLEKFTSQKPNISFLRVFGCLSCIHIQKSTKLQPKARPLVLVGYDDQTKTYHYFDHSRKKNHLQRCSF
jgi:hypothetical protein